MNQLESWIPSTCQDFFPVHIRRIHRTKKTETTFKLTTMLNSSEGQLTCQVSRGRECQPTTYLFPPNYQVIQHRVAVLAIANLVRSINRKSIDWSCHMSQLVIQTILDQYMQDASFLLILRGKFKVSKKFPSKKKMLGTKVTPKGMCELISSI